MERDAIRGTAYFVHAEPVFGSARWRYVITANGATGPVLVSSSTGTYERAETAKAVGVATAHALAKKLRADLR